MRLAPLAVVIPAFDAADSIADVVARARALVPEVLVLDDGSRDGTGEAARRAGAEVLSHPHNRGKGAALRSACELLLARGVQAVVTLDADGQHLPEEIPVLLAAAAEADLVLGTRAAAFAGMSLLRRTANRFSSGLISIAAGQRLPDVQTGFRLYGRRTLQEIGLRGDGFEAESEVVVRAVRQGLRVTSVPIRLARADGRATSHFRPLLDSARIACGVLRARYSG